MSRIIALAHTHARVASRRPAAALPFLLSLVLGTILCVASLLALTGCTNLGEFDEGAVIRQAEQYYAQKYDSNATVTDLWEDRSYQLFGYRSHGQAFCTMSDGATVLVDFEEGVVGDNHQQDEIVSAYEWKYREVLDLGKTRLEDAGYTVSLVLINGFSPSDTGFLDDCISTETWHRNEDAEEESGSFFYTRYSGDERFFEEEASRISLGFPLIEFEVAGADAAYEEGFPTGAPEKPGWADPIDEACRSLLPLTDGEPETSVKVFQSGWRGRAIEENGESGLLGELSPYDHESPTGNWLIVDWISLGKGIYITSHEDGVRLREGDVTLTPVEAPFTFDELKANGSLEERKHRSYRPEAFETYELEVSSGFFASLPEHIRDKGWFSVKVAYDNAGPETGLTQMGITPSALEPSLYTIKNNPAAEDAENEPPFEVNAMRTSTLYNGYQFLTCAVSNDEPLLVARM